MGRYYFTKKATTEETKRIEISWLKQHGYLKGYRSGGIKWTPGWGKESNISITVDTMESPGYMGLRYTITDCESEEKADYDYKISLDTTACNYGGYRYWFICPLVKNGQACGRRAGVVYLPDGAKYFGCRKCYDLTYGSCNEGNSKYSIFGKYFRLSEEVDKLRDSVKMPFRNGKPTHKYRKLMRRLEELGYIGQALDQIPGLDR